jgi:hypothetical protein
MVTNQPGIPVILSRFIDQSKWTFAKTMPENPHFYVVRDKKNESQFIALVYYIRRYGVSEKWGSKNYIYLKHNGMKYWTMGNPIDDTKIINRAII